MATFHGLFWGIALIILGIGLMARFMYQIHFPWFRIIIAFLFIYAGLWLLLLPKFEISNNSLLLFSKGKMHYNENQKEYTILFSNGTLDIKDVQLARTTTAEVNGIFSESNIKVGRHVNFMIKADAAFASFTGPAGNTVSFGSQQYRPSWFDPAKPYLEIKASVVFGSMRVILD